ncbi:PTS system IIBC component [Salmonella enterica subsp. arizonae]|uniref:PTS system IIBC component n=2 Tax=Salmonella enterica subsp. arizonae TaxID=59203 RepID=A0A379T713_SALER|nr:PTS system IIBC component [Salmonella enterica subsp. arizonae]SUG23418.1 PTS system IIBC component [Salmonella enterica subsp. arizonae]SUG30607.1 PTS system IIBC component [Salmonella enterica subsp. arizonae]SUG46384.1 PTS system IIBC component [Salmonella enterica subsp. arizonae]VDY38918.1 PTS system IIBC component [Salmonella enterica subsp. arizonae]
MITDIIILKRPDIVGNVSVYYSNLLGLFMWSWGKRMAITRCFPFWRWRALISYWKVVKVITFGISLTIVAGKVVFYLLGYLIAVIAGVIFTWLLGFNDPEE